MEKCAELMLRHGTHGGAPAAGPSSARRTAPLVSEVSRRGRGWVHVGRLKGGYMPAETAPPCVVPNQKTPNAKLSMLLLSVVSIPQ